MVGLLRKLVVKDGWVVKKRYLDMGGSDEWKEEGRIGRGEGMVK